MISQGLLPADTPLIKVPKEISEPKELSKKQLEDKELIADLTKAEKIQLLLKQKEKFAEEQRRLEKKTNYEKKQQSLLAAKIAEG